MRDQYIGIDLHKAFFQACAITPTGERLWEDRFPRSPAGFAALTARCTTATAMAVEASTPTWHFADAMTAAVGDLCIVDPFRTKLKAGYAAKTERGWDSNPRYGYPYNGFRVLSFSCWRVSHCS